MGSSLTLEDYRNNGISTEIRKHIMKDFNIPIISYSNNINKNINKKLGFRLIRTLKNGTELLKYENKRKTIII